MSVKNEGPSIKCVGNLEGGRGQNFREMYWEERTKFGKGVLIEENYDVFYGWSKRSRIPEGKICNAFYIINSNY